MFTFSKGVPNKHCKILARILRIGKITKTDKYLGTLLFFHRSKSFNYQCMLDKVYHRIKGWKAQLLSQAGRAVLITSVTSVMPMYQMMCFVLPHKTLDRLNALQRDFWWKRKEGSKGSYIKAWDFLCKKKASGGLGFRNPHKFNLALLTRLAWRLRDFLCIINTNTSSWHRTSTIW